MMVGIIRSLFLLGSISLSCGTFGSVFAVTIENYLKKAGEKTGNHGIRNVDCAYIINLDQRPEKLKNCTDQLTPYGIFPHRFSAVNGWELSLETINDVGVQYKSGMTKKLLGTSYLLEKKGEPHHEIMHIKGRSYFCHHTARGTIGITLSHLSVLKDAYDSGYKAIWVMEDDIQVIRDPNLISSYIDTLDALVGSDGWDILFTDKDIKDMKGNYVPCFSYAPRPNFTPQNPERFAIRQQVGTDFMKVGARYGAHSMIIRRSGIKKLLDYFLKYRIFLPYDMDFFMPNDIRLFSLTDDVVSNMPGAFSDNAEPKYKNLGIEKYLKKAGEKTSDHGLKNIDCAYIINLDQRPEKLKSCTDQLSPYNISPFRFSAVNGWELSLETVNTLGVKYDSDMRKELWGTSYLSDQDWMPHHEIMQVEGRNYFCHCMARGPIGIVLSHLSVLKDAYDAGYKTIWVMEDDIQVIRDPNLISTYIEKLDALVGSDQWDILFTDRDTKNQRGEYVPCMGYAQRPNFTPKNPERFAMRQQVGTEFMKVGARYGAYSMIVRRPAMKKILNFIDQYRIFLPYDMEFYLPDSIKLYALLDDVVSTLPQAISDNGAPGYQKK